MKKKSNVGAFLTLAFFLFFPVSGLLWFWNDAHSKIRRGAETFIEESFEPMATSLQNGEPNEDTSIAFRDSYDATFFEGLDGKIDLVSAKPVESWAREEEDMGVQYARLNVETTIGGSPQDFEVVLRRLTIGPRWRYHEVIPKDK